MIMDNFKSYLYKAFDSIILATTSNIAFITITVVSVLITLCIFATEALFNRICLLWMSLKNGYSWYFLSEIPQTECAVSGRGDKDVQSVAEELPTIGPKIGWDLRF